MWSPMQAMLVVHANYTQISAPLQQVHHTC